MDYSLTFARHFSRLVWLLLHEPASIDEQKAALRALVTISKEGPVVLSAAEWRLKVNGELLPDALTGVQDLAAQLTGHAVQELAIDRGAAPADLLGVARILAGEATPGDGGRTIEGKVRALDARTLRIRTGGLLGVDLGSLDESMIDGGAEAAAPDDAPPPPAAPPRSSTEIRLDAQLREMQVAERERKVGAFDAGAPAAQGGRVGEDPFLTFSAAPNPTGAPAPLLAQLDATRSVNTTTRLLDELVTMAENAQREGRHDDVAEVFHGVVKREASLSDPDLKRAYVMAVRRMAKPTLLRAVAVMLSKKRDRLDEYMTVLARTGEDGADALIEQLTNAQSLSERRIYFDALAHLNAGVPALIHMLGDARWYVARNAADLLGEMQASEAELPLTELLKHDDDRVRRAASTALARLGTPRAVEALHAALRDSSPDVRKQAAAGLSIRKGTKSAGTLAKALDDEQDTEVQLEIIKGLGRLATPDAVQKLIKAAEPEGRLFRKKSVDFRIAAVRALGEARTAAAVTMLMSLTNDREPKVREAVVQLTMASLRKDERPT